MPMGTVVWVSAESGIDLILVTKRGQVFHPDGMTQLGIDPASYRGIVVKSSQHFYAGFEPIAASIQYISAPGAIPPEFATIPLPEFLGPLLAPCGRPLGITPTGAFAGAGQLGAALPIFESVSGFVV